MEIFPGGRNAGWQEAVSIFKLFALLMNSHYKMSIALYLKPMKATETLSALRNLYRSLCEAFIYAHLLICVLILAEALIRFILSLLLHLPSFFHAFFCQKKKKRKEKKSYNFYETFCQNA